MSRRQPDLQAQLLRAWEHALTEIVENATRGLNDAWWQPDVQFMLTKVKRLAEVALNAKSAYVPTRSARKKSRKTRGATHEEGL